MLTEDRSDPENPEPVAVMIDRNMHMYEVSVLARDEFYEKGLLVDGELIHSSAGENEYHVFDIICSNNEPLYLETYTKRLTRVFSLFALSTDADAGHILPMDEHDGTDISWIDDERKVVAAREYPSLRFIPKRAVQLDHLSQLHVHDTPSKNCNTPHATDGYILTRISEPARTGRARNMAVVKWKPSDRQTIDVQFGPDMVPLCKTDVGHCTVPLRTVQLSQTEYTFVTDPKSEITLQTCPENAVLECNMAITDKNTIILTIARVRHDKSDPNTLATIKSAICHIIENISVDELLNLFMDL